MGKSEAFQSQCERIQESLDKLSDWEVDFYLYCLLPKLIEKYESIAKDIKLNNSGINYLAREHLRQDTARLKIIREALASALF